MLSEASSVGVKKSRIVAARLETLGFKTHMTERPFDGATRRGTGEPGIALVGVDDPAPRRLLETQGSILSLTLAWEAMFTTISMRS